jgi:hypothetical protein
MEASKSFLGTGWAFPITFNREQFTVNMASEVQDIEQSLTILFNTRPGERVMRPSYGSGLEDLMFEPVDQGLITFIKEMITNAILYYEPRVNLQHIEILTDPSSLQEGRVQISLDLIVRSSNGRFNYVYDFYKRESTIQPNI